MRGLLKKKGGAMVSAGMVTTWHWRYCVLHHHALAIHEGRSVPGNLRSALPLKHALRIDVATEKESGKRDFAFAIETDLGRAWTFCCMSQADLELWLRRLRECATRTHAAGLSNALQSGQDSIFV